MTNSEDEDEEIGGSDDSEMEELEREIERERQRESGRLKKNNTSRLTRLVEEGARFGVSDEGLASLANAVHIDDGVNLRENPSMVVTPGKVRSQREQHLTALSEREVPPTKSIYFDGKRTKTLHQDLLEDGSYHQSVQVDDHYAVCDGARQAYVGEFVVEKGTGTMVKELQMT